MGSGRRAGPSMAPEVTETVWLQAGHQPHAHLFLSQSIPCRDCLCTPTPRRASPKPATQPPPQLRSSEGLSPSLIPLTAQPEKWGPGRDRDLPKVTQSQHLNPGLPSPRPLARLLPAGSASFPAAP